MQRIFAIFDRAKQSQFLRSVAVLGTGTVLAQVIVIAASPILTRLYDPVDFGLAGLFAAIVASITPAICGKFEVAIVVAKSVAASRQLLGVAFYFAFGVSVLALLAILLFGTQIVEIFDAERLGEWLLLVPVMLLLTGLMAGLKHYSNRIHEYGVISQSKMLMAITGVAASLVLGIAGFPSGLLVGSVIAAGTVACWLLYHHRAISIPTTLIWNARKRVLAARYRAFPLYSGSTGLLHGFTQTLPVFFLSGYFGQAVVGYFALMLQVAFAPLGFVSGAVSQVNLKKVSDLVNQGLPVRPYLLKVTLLLVTIVAPVAIVLIVIAPKLFAWVFGEQWRVAGSYLQILMPALALRFVVSTVSTTFGATGNNHLGAIWKITSFVVTLSVLGIAAPRVDVYGIFFVLLITDLVLYSFHYILVWRAAGHPRAHR